MMRFTLTPIAILLGLLLLAVPEQGLAQYLTPEQVLDFEDFWLPPNPRSARDRVEDQMRRSAERRQLEQDALFAEQRARQRELEGEDAPVALDDSIDTLADAIAALLRGEIPTSPEGRRTNRLLDRVYLNQEEISTSAKRGAPLAGTGPASILAALAVTAAGIWTLRKARKFEI